MSEQQGQKWTTMTETERNRAPDDSEPTVERQVELSGAYEMNIAEGKPPYDGVAIHTRGELTWVPHSAVLLNHFPEFC